MALEQEEKTLTKYWQPVELHQLKNETNNLKIVHLNISTLKVSFYGIFQFIKYLWHSESRLKRNKQHATNLPLNLKYWTLWCGGCKWGNVPVYKIRYCIQTEKWLKMCKSKHLESTFIETIIQQNKNITLGCVYRHPCMELNEFSSDQKWKKWLKLLKYKNYFNTSLVPKVTTPTHLSPRSKILIDNIFTTNNTKYTISGNIITIISNNLAQFEVENPHNLYCFW